MIVSRLKPESDGGWQEHRFARTFIVFARIAGERKNRIVTRSSETQNTDAARDQTMEPAIARIPAHSRREAMDWGLVLVSQGIEATIEASEDGSGWGLVVAAQDYEQALSAIGQYRLENRGWPWQQPVLQQGYLFDWGSLAWVLLVLLFFWLDGRADLRSAGAMDTRLLAQGQWWRLLTAIWLHADLGHLAANATLGFVLLGLAMGRYGTGVGLLAACLAGVGGNLGCWLLALGGHRSLGASGMIMGALGLLAAQSFAWRARAPQARKLVFSGILAGVMLFVLLGLSPGTDILAHLAGFLSGLLLGGVLTLLPALAQKATTNLLAGLLFALLVILPWWLAFRQS
jgi:membrane associated rhomboid family serine protease